MTSAELDAIEARAKHALREVGIGEALKLTITGHRKVDELYPVAMDAEELVAEVRRLREAVAEAWDKSAALTGFLIRSQDGNSPAPAQGGTPGGR